MARTAHAEEGFTLVELLVYGLVLVIVLTIVGGLLISSLSTERSVRSVTSASTTGQLAAESIVTGIRNSSGFAVSTPVPSDQMVVARVAGSGDSIDWTCTAWYYSAAGDGSIRSTRSASAIAAPTAAQLAAWTLITEGVDSIGGSPVFAVGGTDTLAIMFHSLAGDRPPVAIESSAVSRAGAPGGTACY